MSELTEFRLAKDEFFASHPQSPLTAEQRAVFAGLSYFPENADLRIEVEIDIFPEQENITVQTSTGDLRTYIRHGRIHFEVRGESVQLTILENDLGYFLPFVDSLANTKTYGAGRYLEPEILPNGKLLVDFNLAYNPFCAYNQRWSCPLTPWENRVKVPIEAGEKLPDSAWAEHE